MADGVAPYSAFGGTAATRADGDGGSRHTTRVRGGEAWARRPAPRRSKELRRPRALHWGARTFALPRAAGACQLGHVHRDGARPLRVDADRGLAAERHCW